MNVKLSIFIFFFSGSVFAQNADTAFLLRDVKEPIHHVVFIDSTDKFRQRLLDFSFDNFDTLTYSEALRSITPLNHKWFKSCVGFPRKWVAVYPYKGSYYLYYPSDFGNHYAFEITDSLAISYEMEGPLPGKTKLLKCSLPDEVAFEMKIADNSHQVDIKMIDATNGIAEFKFLNEDKVELKRLMVGATKAGKLLTIVNYCKTNRMEEFKFESIE